MDTEQPDTPVFQRALLERSGFVLALCILGSAAIQFGFVQLAVNSHSNPDALDSALASHQRFVEISDRYERVFYPQGRLPWQYPPPPQPMPPRRTVSVQVAPWVVDDLIDSLGAPNDLDAAFGSPEDRASEKPGVQWKVGLEKASVEGGLSTKSIEQTGEDHLDELASCFVAALEEDPGTAVQHRLTVRLTIDQTWGVEHVQMTDVTFEADEGYDALDACLRRRFKAWRFPIFTAEEPTVATFAITVTRVPAETGRTEAGRRP